MPPFFERLLDRLRHLQLSAAKLVRRMRLRKQSTRSEELMESRASFGR
jgi:hypothetical protein